MISPTLVDFADHVDNVDLDADISRNKYICRICRQILHIHRHLRSFECICEKNEIYMHLIVFV